MKVEATVDVGANLTSLLERLAQQIGTTADKVFPWYVQQAHIEGVTTLVAVSFGLILSASVFLLACKRAHWEDDSFNRYTAACILSCVVFFFSILGTVLGGVDATRKLMNPNYYAMKMLTRDIGQLRGR